jgi:hypothetical protein
MNTYRKCLALVGTLLLSIPAAMNIAHGDEPVPAKQDSIDRIIAAGLDAKSHFRPLTNEDFKLVKIELVEAVARLDARLKEDGPNGQKWREFLLWDALQKELQQEGMPNRDRLTEVYKRYASGNEGLALVWFSDVQSSLQRMLMVMGAVDNPQIKVLHDQTLDKLAERLKTYSSKPNTEDARDISESVRWLINARQAPELVEAVQRHFNHPNLYAEVSADLVAAGLGEPVDDTAPICDYIMGTDVSGTGHTVGQTTAELIPDAQHGLIDTLLFATTHSTTVGLHGPVCIYSDGTTNIGACKRLWFNEYGIFSYPAVSNAVTRTTITDIQAKRRIIEKMAWKKAGKQKGAAEQVAAQHAEQRVNDRVDKQAAESLDKAQKDFTEKFRRPLCEHKLFPEQLLFNTDKQAIHIVSLQTGNSRIAAPTPPPTAVQADLVLRVHESMINNSALDALGGMTVHEEKFQEAVVKMLGKLPEKMKSLEEDHEPWAITFARRQPISVTFADDGFIVTLRGAEYFKGENSYPAMDVTASYKIEKSADGFKFVRQGDIQILPPGRQQVGGKEQIIRKLLMRRFSKVFEPEMKAEGFVFTGKWEKVGKMLPVDVQSRDGWLTIAWQRAPTDKNANKVAGGP